jgi:hypothetical protein
MTNYYIYSFVPVLDPGSGMGKNQDPGCATLKKTPTSRLTLS